MSQPKYRYDIDDGLIYELKDSKYEPIISPDDIESDWELSTAGEAKLEFMKEHQLEMYVLLVEQNGLLDYIKDFSSEFASHLKVISEQMSNDANSQAIAREIAYAQMFERRN